MATAMDVVGSIVLPVVGAERYEEEPAKGQSIQPAESAAMRRITKQRGELHAQQEAFGLEKIAFAGEVERQREAVKKTERELIKLRAELLHGVGEREDALAKQKLAFLAEKKAFLAEKSVFEEARSGLLGQVRDEKSGCDSVQRTFAEERKALLAQIDEKNEIIGKVQKAFEILRKAIPVGHYSEQMGEIQALLYSEDCL